MIIPIIVRNRHEMDTSSFVISLKFRRRRLDIIAKVFHDISYGLLAAVDYSDETSNHRSNVSRSECAPWRKGTRNRTRSVCLYTEEESVGFVGHDVGHESGCQEPPENVRGAKL